MARALGRIGLVLLLALAAPGALAQQQNSGDTDDNGILSEEPIVLLPDWWLPGSGNEGRKDVREVTLPPPPSGPASQFCSPSSPVCP